MVWNTSREDETLVATSGIGDDSHREPVAKVQWVPDLDSQGKKYNVSEKEFTKHQQLCLLSYET